ncbi:unnamed protein product [Bursaphelenchus okinawaensis]|uniref:Uncharacterized protein n=1 Tax=Bursaphelenchus okinawaensis TaxID=465554 RepID=A0A811LC61_9BILA|nr:unnamed protein product [Bursaphelenchus okinawaensis]CAG9120249.1 unnamed protein product [Bursaphelenchus okinawaensis]
MTLDNVMEWCNWASHIKIVDVKRGNTIGDPLEYTVKHLEEFKSSKSPLPEKIQTMSRAVLCGVPHLEVDEEYFVGGFKDNGILTLDKCAQPYIEMYNGTGIGKAPPRWASINEKNLKRLRNMKDTILAKKKEL